MINIKKYSLLLVFAVLFFSVHEGTAQKQQQKSDYVVVLHGGAGSYSPAYVTAERKNKYEHSFSIILNRAKAMLENGADAIDVVELCISMMEDDSLYNAGKGAVFTHDGGHTLDASIMDGRDRNAGSVAGVEHTKNPIQAARLVLDSSVHVLLSGKGADEFAKMQGLRQVDQSYYDTYRRKQMWKNRKEDSKKGTVGCVVLDKAGNLAAGTSTGGMTMKRYGRIGDSPIIGAGTYADNSTCAVSCTGHGEYFIRYAVAHDLHSRMKYAGQDLTIASESIIDFLSEKSVSGGFISVDKYGNVATPFNTNGMLTGIATDKKMSISIYKGER